MKNKIFTVMTYNVHEAVGCDHRQDYRRIGNVIREINPDILTLQEVDASLGEPTTPYRSFLFETITQMFQYIGIKGLTMIRSRSAYGNAIFLKNKPKKVYRHDISFQNREPRGVIDCNCQINNSPLRIMNTHLGLKKRERKTQLKTIKQLLHRESKVPTLLAGDFNEWKRMIFSHPLKELEREINMVPYQGTFPARLPLFPLDRIFYRGNIRLLDFHVHKSSLSRIASDHLPFAAKFSLT